MRRYFFGAVVMMLLACASAFAQQTTGTVTGRVLDQQGAAVPGATVTAKNPLTGFTRTETSDAEGVYRLAALPVGIYEVNAELQGFINRLALFLSTWQATTFLIGEYSEAELPDNPLFTVADGLFWLSQNVERNSVVRKLQIVKSRDASRFSWSRFITACERRLSGAV